MNFLVAINQNLALGAVLALSILVFTLLVKISLLKEGHRSRLIKTQKRYMKTIDKVVDSCSAIDTIEKKLRTLSASRIGHLKVLHEYMLRKKISTEMLERAIHATNCQNLRYESMVKLNSKLREWRNMGCLRNCCHHKMLLSTDLLRYIASFADDDDLFRFRMVCRSFHNFYYQQRVNKKYYKFHKTRALSLAIRWGRSFPNVEYIKFYIKWLPKPCRGSKPLDFGAIFPGLKCLEVIMDQGAPYFFHRLKHSRLSTMIVSPTDPSQLRHLGMADLPSMRELKVIVWNQFWTSLSLPFLPSLQILTLDTRSSSRSRFTVFKVDRQLLPDLTKVVCIFLNHKTWSPAVNEFDLPLDNEQKPIFLKLHAQTDSESESEINY